MRAGSEYPGSDAPQPLAGEGMVTTTIDLRVYYEDTDASGVVYHVSYLRFLERGRSEWLRALAFSQQALREDAGVVFTVAEIDVRYLRAARLEDRLTVTTAVEALRRASLVFRQQVRREGESIVEARVRVACVRAEDFRPCALPAALYEAALPEDAGKVG